MNQADHFSLALDTISAVDSHEDPRMVIGEFGKYARSFGFLTVAFAQLANPANTDDSDVIRLSTWPKEWVTYWCENNLLLTDPIAKMALAQNKPFRWSEAAKRHRPFSKAAREMFTSFGFNEGWSIPVRTGDGLPGCISLSCDSFDLEPAESASIELVAMHCFVRLEKLLGAGNCGQPANLTKRETEILHFVAAGKTNWEVGKILSISEYHVRDCLKSVYRKLDAVSRAHCVALAIKENLIFP